jgi:hypothetical protein
MKWFDKWFRKNCEKAWASAKEQEKLVQVSPTAFRGNEVNEDMGTRPLRLRVFRANGGTVIETRQYDRNDHDQVQLHIVGHDDDLGHSIAKIITMESLRQ